MGWKDAPEVKAPAWASAPEVSAPADEPFPVKLGRQVLNAGAGALRGAGSIGATIMAPKDIVSDLMDGKGLTLASNRERRRLMDEGFASMGADTGSLAYGAGKIGAEVAGTLGVGGAVANTVGRLPGVAAAAPNLLNAIRTGGMTAGPANTLANLATRSAGGAITGGASAALVDPDAAKFGAALGGALPVATKVSGEIGRWIGSTQAGQAVASAFKSGGEKAAIAAIRAMGMQGREAELLGYLKLGSGEIVSGSKPTVAQSLVGSPMESRAGVYERVVSKSPGGERLLDAYGAQGAARKNALEVVAPTNALGYQQARADTGDAIERFATRGDAAARAKTSALYESVPQDEAALYLPDLGSVRDKYFGPGSFVDRAPADRAVAEAMKIGNLEIPAAKAVSKGPNSMTLAQAVRKNGGISIVENDGLRGEVQGLRGDLKNLVRRNGGMTPGRMAEAMHEAGYIPNEDAATLFAALRNDAMGQPQYAIGDDLSRSWQASADSAAGGLPGASTVPKKVTLREFDNLRQSIGIEQRAADKAGNSKLAKSLSDMKAAMDDRVNQVVAGDGAIDEQLPIEWANMLDAARKAKVDQVSQFRTGPQAAIFKRGADGEMQRRGGEVASLFWGNRPGLAEDVQAFRRLTKDSPELMGQFKSMITTEGLSTQTKTGQELSAKFPQWVDQHITGLREALSPAELESVQRIAQDIQRALKAGVAGKGPGATSDTFQLAANALNGGLLDSTAAKAISARIPFGQAARSWGAERVGMSRARNAADFLADSGEAQNQLAALLGAAGKKPNALQRLLSSSDLAQLGYRVTPALAAGR